MKRLLYGTVRIRKNLRSPRDPDAHLVRRPVTPGHEVGRHVTQDRELLCQLRVVGTSHLHGFTCGDRNGGRQVVGLLIVEVVIGNIDDGLRL